MIFWISCEGLVFWVLHRKEIMYLKILPSSSKSNTGTWWQSRGSIWGTWGTCNVTKKKNSLGSKVWLYWEWKNHLAPLFSAVIYSVKFFPCAVLGWSSADFKVKFWWFLLARFPISTDMRHARVQLWWEAEEVLWSFVSLFHLQKAPPLPVLKRAL